jgi:hypothetical protein
MQISWACDPRSFGHGSAIRNRFAALTGFGLDKKMEEEISET